jgi:SP family general alpha glucoside:H+ symporter-like MFS transporter
LTASGTYEVPARWQAGLSNGAQVGQIFGLLGMSHNTHTRFIEVLTNVPVNGYATERYGYRKVCLASLVWLAAVTAIFFTAPNVKALLAAEILAGVPWGVFQASTSLTLDI